MAVRVRFLDKSLPTQLRTDGIMSCNLTATNESGSAIELAESLSLVVSLAEASTGLPLPAGAPLSIREARANIGCDGHGSLFCRLVSAAGAWRRPVRLMLASPVPATVRPRGAEALVRLPVLPVYTRALTLSAGIPLVPGEDLFALATAGGIMLEEPTRITAGFGSILWDAALVMDEWFAEIGGEASIPRAPRQAPVPRPSPTISSSQRIAAALTSLRWRGLRVCDLGSGTGAVGLAAARRGSRVLLTDLPEMLPLARLNAATASGAVKKAGGEIAVAPLVWSEEEAPLGFCLHDSTARSGSQLLARCCGGVAGPFDVVIASECAFRAELFSALVMTVRRLQPRLVLVSARDRGCCDVGEYIGMLCEHFEAAEITPAAQPSSPAPPPCSSSGSEESFAALISEGRLATLPLLPPRAASMAVAARVLSKRSHPPRIFAMLPRVVESSV